jgi:hypothetical protein
LNVLLVAVTAAIISVTHFLAQAQAMPYADADSPGEAVGMFKMTISLAALMKQNCTTRFPELQTQIERDDAKWRALDIKEIDAAERRFRKMEEASPKLSQQFPEMVRQGYENKLVMPFKRMDPSVERKVVRDYCQQFFRELSSGVWRQRTPNTYKYLSQ